MTPLTEELDVSDAEKMAPMFLSPCDWLVTIYKLMIGQLHAITAERKLAGSTIFRESAMIRMLCLQSVFKRSIALDTTEQTLL